MRIAIVDDSPDDSGRLNQYIQQYQEEKQVSFQIDIFNASFDFLEEFRGQYDAVFLDIEMPGSSGLEVAREIRERDKAVGIIFVTSLAQYAVEGYEVNAIDYMVKPIRYFSFKVKLEKALKFFKNHQEQNILIKGKDGIVKINVAGLTYVEKDRDDLVFHTEDEILRERGSIKDIKDKLSEYGIAECTAGCLVNMNHIKRLGKDIVTLVDGTELPLSRRNKKAFTDRYIDFMGGL